MRSRGTDFFISHAGRDTAWAEWLGWQLQEIGCTVELDVWDWAPGQDFVARMAAALESADRLLAVCTQAYFASAFGGAELRAAFAGQSAAEGQIVPVDELEPPRRNPIEYVIHCLTTGEPITGPLSPALSRIGQQIVDTAVRSAREKRTVPLLGVGSWERMKDEG